MPTFKTEESRQAYHLYRQQLTEGLRKERTERKQRLYPPHCRYCKKPVQYVPVPIFRKTDEGLIALELKIDPQTKKPHVCEPYLQQKTQPWLTP